jgi:hypothetical protein
MWSTIIALATKLGYKAIQYVLAHKDELIAMGINAAIELLKYLFG